MNKGSIKALAVGSILLVGSIGLVQPVLAATDNTVRDTVVQNRCDRITGRIDTIISTYDQNKEKHITRYQNIKDSITNLVTKLDAKNYDVTKVTNDLQTLDSMVKDFATTYTSFVVTLKQSKTYACGDSEGQFKTTLEDARSTLAESREKAQSVIDFVQNTIRPDVKDLKNQHPNQN